MCTNDIQLGVTEIKITLHSRLNILNTVYSLWLLWWICMCHRWNKSRGQWLTTFYLPPCVAYVSLIKSGTTCFAIALNWIHKHALLQIHRGLDSSCHSMAHLTAENSQLWRTRVRESELKNLVPVITVADSSIGISQTGPFATDTLSTLFTVKWTVLKGSRTIFDIPVE